METGSIRKHEVRFNRSDHLKSEGVIGSTIFTVKKKVNFICTCHLIINHQQTLKTVNNSCSGPACGEFTQTIDDVVFELYGIRDAWLMTNGINGNDSIYFLRTKNGCA